MSELTVGDVVPKAVADTIEIWSTDDVHPYVNNPKEHPEEQIEKIQSSIKNYGMDQPIVVDGDGEIIKGHGRFKALKRLGLDEVPVLPRPDLDEAEIKGARIADNKTSMESGWDMDTLAVEFEDLDRQDDFEVEDTAFEEDEVDAVMETSEFSLDDFFEEDDEIDEDDEDTGDDTQTETVEIAVECPECETEFTVEHEIE